MSYELTDTPPGQDGPPSACEPNPELRVPISKAPLRYYGVVDPKGEICDVMGWYRPQESKDSPVDIHSARCTNQCGNTHTLRMGRE